MPNLSFTIGQVSRMLSIPADTLRFYDRTGLLSPETRGENRYRYYSLAQIETLITIKVMREMGTSIQRIRRILSVGGLCEARELVAEKRAEIQRQREYLKHLSRKLDALDGGFAQFLETTGVELVMSGKYWVFLTDSIIESERPNLDRAIQREASKLGDHMWIAFCHTISIVKREDVMRLRVHKYAHNGVLSFVPIAGGGSAVRELEARYCAHKCVVIEGEGYDAMDAHYGEMLAFIKRRGLRVDGDALEINIFNQYDRHYIEIWIPVAEEE